MSGSICTIGILVAALTVAPGIAIAQPLSSSPADIAGPRQLTLPPHYADDEQDAGIATPMEEIVGAASVLPNARGCGANTMVLPPSDHGVPFKRLPGSLGADAQPSCRAAITDTNPPSILAAPPRGVTGLDPDAKLAQNRLPGPRIVGP